MPLLKEHAAQQPERLPRFETMADAVAYFERHGKDFQRQSHGAERIAAFEGGARYLAKRLAEDPYISKEMAVKIASILAKLDPEAAPIETVMELLKVHNAYIRNLGISILQGYGSAIRESIAAFLNGDDSDLRIFAINVLGDVDFAESRELLAALLEKEEEINVAMTAVDYMGEIGEERDIPLLESLKERFDDPYAAYAVDSAIRAILG